MLSLPKDIIAEVILPLIPLSSQFSLLFGCKRLRDLISKFIIIPPRVSNFACAALLDQICEDGDLSLVKWFLEYLTYPLQNSLLVSGKS